MRYLFIVISLVIFSSLASINSAEAQSSKKDNLSLSVYQNGMALVKDTQTISLNTGKNSVSFRNVAEKILPETAFIQGDNVEVLEQNYNFDLLTPANIVDESVGKIVKTALFDEKSGKTIFDKAKIIDSRYGKPILEFDYGIDVNFPGRLIFDKLPDHLVSSPTLSAEILTPEKDDKSLVLTYLTKGMSWKVDYIAELNSDNLLNLRGWITLNNESGTDFTNASLQFVAGDVNQINLSYAEPKPLMLSVRGAQNADMSAMSKTAALNQIPQVLGDYYFYTLPFRTDVLNNQSKQLALLEKTNVTYEKVYKLVSPLYLWNGLTGGSFEKLMPEVIIKLNNDKTSGLGEILPKGVIRFYDKTHQDSLQFIGENVFEKLAVGEQSEIKIGKTFDLTAAGKVVNVKKINDDTIEALIEVVFKNASNKNESIIFVQSFNALWNEVSQSIDMNAKSAEKAEWVIEVPAKKQTVLSYKVQLSSVQNQN